VLEKRRKGEKISRGAKKPCKKIKAVFYKEGDAPYSGKHLHLCARKDRKDWRGNRTQRRPNGARGKERKMGSPPKTDKGKMEGGGEKNEGSSLSKWGNALTVGCKE